MNKLIELFRSKNRMNWKRRFGVGVYDKEKKNTKFSRLLYKGCACVRDGLPNLFVSKTIRVRWLSRNLLSSVAAGLQKLRNINVRF